MMPALRPHYFADWFFAKPRKFRAASATCSTMRAQALAPQPHAIHRRLLARNHQKPWVRLRFDWAPINHAAITLTIIAGHWRRLSGSMAMLWDVGRNLPVGLNHGYGHGRRNFSGAPATTRGASFRSRRLPSNEPGKLPTSPSGRTLLRHQPRQPLLARTPAKQRAVQINFPGSGRSRPVRLSTALDFSTPRHSLRSG
jgi:hypothetical protein